MNAESVRPFPLKACPARIPGYGLLLGMLCLGQGTAEEKAKPAGPGAAIPSLLMAPLFKGEADLLWRSGQSLPGQLESGSDTFLIWKSPIFQSPLKLENRGLERVRFPSAALPRRTTAFRVVLRDGSHLGGTPEAADARTLTFNSTHGGRVVLQQDQICLLERIEGPDLIVAGPQQLLQGTQTNPANQQNLPEPWYFTAAGQVASPAFNQGLSLPVRFPDKCHLDFEMICDSAPAFALTMGSKEGRCTVETWGDELVLTDEAEFASAGRVYKPGDRIVRVRLTWDRPAGRSTLYAADGKVMAEMLSPPDPDGPDKTKKPKPKAKAKGGGLLGAVGQLLGIGGPAVVPEPTSPDPVYGRGLTFQNKGGGVRITRLTLAEWNGLPLPPASAPERDLPLIETGDAMASGTLTSLQNGILTSQQADGSQREWPLSSVRRILWNRQPDLGPSAGLTNLWLADGDLIRGRMSPAPGGTVGLQTAFAPDPVPVSLTGALALELPRPVEVPPAAKDGKGDSAAAVAPALLPPPRGAPGVAGEPQKVPVAAGDQDLLVAKGMKLQGRIHAGGSGNLPRFQPTGAVEPADPVPDPSLVMTWARAPVAATPRGRRDALLHLRGDESLPVQLSGVDRQHVRFFWQGPESREVDASLVEAIQFPRPAMANPGFDGPGWQSINASKPLAPRTENLLVLEPGSGVVHPFMLQGAPLRFGLKRKDGLASIRVRLFCQGAERNTGDLSFMIADFGGTVYCGQELGEGRMNSQQEIPAQEPHNKVSISFPAPDKVELQVNGVTAATATRSPKQVGTRATGLVIETASMWGNEVGAVILSDFASEVSSFIQPPPGYAEDARKEALLLPRLRREDPPRQVLIGFNGDLLRGEIEAMTSTHLGFRAGLETFKVPLDRVAAAVWVKPPAEPKPAAEAAPAEPAPAESGPPRQWLDLTNGGRLALAVTSWDAGGVTGQHPLLGECRIPLESLSSLSVSAPPALASHAALSDWTLQPTADPVLPEAGSSASPLVGTAAHRFKLPLLDGGHFALEGHAGKVVVLDFWASWCGPCVKGLPDLLDALAGFPADQVTFLGVNQGESVPVVKRFLEARNLQFTVAMDADQQVAGKYGVDGIPHTVVIGPDGKVVHVKTGYTPGAGAEIAAAVRKALAGQK